MFTPIDLFDVLGALIDLSLVLRGVLPFSSSPSREALPFS